GLSAGPVDGPVAAAGERAAAPPVDLADAGLDGADVVPGEGEVPRRLVRAAPGVARAGLPAPRAEAAHLEAHVGALAAPAEGAEVTVGEPAGDRSEERRVGKECRARWGRDQ